MKRILLSIGALVTLTVLATAPGWLTSYDQALKFAKKSRRPILINFTGSDWCSWCKRMQTESLGTKEFVQFASSNLLLVELDFPNARPQSAEVKRVNGSLKDQFQITGFPTYVLVDADGRELGRKVGYLKGGPEAMVATLTGWMDAAKPAAPGPSAATSAPAAPTAP